MESCQLPTNSQSARSPNRSHGFAIPTALDKDALPDAGLLVQPTTAYSGANSGLGPPLRGVGQTHPGKAVPRLFWTEPPDAVEWYNRALCDLSSRSVNIASSDIFNRPPLVVSCQLLTVTPRASTISKAPPASRVDRAARLHATRSTDRNALSAQSSQLVNNPRTQNEATRPRPWDL